jgi:ATP-binding protein involved in chromosome partitioning
MLSENDILAALRGVMDPELGKNIVELGMVRNIQIEGTKVAFSLVLTVLGCPMREQMKQQAEKALLALPDVKEVEVTFGSMTPEERRALMGEAQPVLPKLNSLTRIDRVVAVMSGKGGVGKSSVTALLASALARLGYKVGVMDADITGPSIPKLFGLPAGGLRGSPQGILPGITRGGIRVVSTNLLVPQEDTAVIWRGPMITGTIRQFWADVLWGKLDVLLVDLPPGTADATISVMQTLPVSAALLVTTPQQLASLVVRKAVHMLQDMKIPIMGIVENMSYYPCPDTGSRHEIFGPSHAEEIAAAACAPVSARLAIDPRVTTLGDGGEIEQIQIPEIDELAAAVMQLQPSAVNGQTT